jgi:hypothetical protein
MIGHFYTPRDVFQQVSIGGSHAESSAFAATTKRIVLVSTVDCYVTLGTAPVATSAGYYLVAKVPTSFSVLPSEKVSCLQVSSGGTLSVAEGRSL